MITASQVKELREKTGAGMMDCKKVLTETNGDEEKAIELLRERGIAKAAKKSDRIAAEGLVETYISEDGKVGVVVEVNAETDFVAKNEEFRNFVADVAKQIAKENPADVEALLEQKSIAELKRNGILRIRPAKKGPDSVIQGISFMQQYHIVVDDRCVKLIEELDNYTYQKDRKTNEYINKPVDSYNHVIDAIRYALEPINGQGTPKAKIMKNVLF